MIPSKARQQELQVRFQVTSGRFFGEYRFKNLNWYLGDVATMTQDADEWFCYGDIKEEDIPRLQEELKGDEVLVLGWKDKAPDRKEDSFFGTGFGVWMIIKPEGVLYDVRRDSKVTCANPECPQGGQCKGLCAALF